MSATQLTVESIKSKRLLYLVSATITLLVLGLIYAWSIFAAPIGQTYEAYKPMLSQVFQVSMFAFCLSGLVGAQIVRKFSAKVSIIVAAVCMVLGFTLTAQFAGLGIWALFIFYGIFAGSGCGIAYNAILSLVNPWFPDRIGLASGTMMMGFGVSSLVFGTLANALFGVMNWSIVFMLIAAVAFVIMLLLAFIAKPAPSDISAKLGVAGAAAGVRESPTQMQFVLKTKTFWSFWAWCILIVACGLTLLGTSRQGAEALHLQEIISVGFPALLVGLVSTMNGLGRIANGMMFDRIGLVPVMLFSSVVALLCMLGLSFSLALSIGPLYIVAAILVALPYAAAPVLSASFVRRRYGAKNFPVNLGIITCSIAIAATLNIIIQWFLGSPAGVYAPVIYGILAGFAVVSFIGALVFSRFYKADMATIEKELS